MKLLRTPYEAPTAEQFCIQWESSFCTSANNLPDYNYNPLNLFEDE